MKYSILVSLIFCAYISVSQSLISEDHSEVDMALEVLALAAADTEELQNQLVLAPSYYKPKGNVRSLSYYEEGAPKYKWVFNSYGDLLLQFKFGQPAYDMVSVQKDNVDGIRYHSDKINYASDTLEQYNDSGQLTSRIYKNKGIITEELISGDNTITDIYLFDDQKLSRVTRHTSKNKKALEILKLKYKEDNVIEYVSLDSNGKKQKSKLDQASETKKIIDKKGGNLELISLRNDSLGIVSTFVILKGDTIKRRTYDQNLNLLKDGTNTYTVQYFENSNEEALSKELQNLVYQHYYNLNKEVNRISYDLKGNGYARNEQVLDLVRYPYMIGMQENRFITNKPMLDTETVPDIEFGPLEKVYENDRSTYYKLYMKEQIEVHFPNEKNLEKQVIRMRAKFKNVNYTEERLNKTLFINAEGEYILIKKNKANNQWELG